MANVAIYIRWSTEDQAQGTTLATQLETCRLYCDQQGWFVPDERVFIDDGHSGGTLYRPAMTRLREAVAAGQIDVVVSYRLDRLSRNLADATNLVDKEWKGKALVRSATEDVLPEKDEGWLNYSFRAAFADYERRVIRQRTYGGKLRRIREGKWVHGSKAPFGWRRTSTPGVFEVDEAAAQVIRTLYWKTVHENMGGPALAKWANGEGIVLPRGGKWRSPNVLKLLANPVYGGKLVFGRLHKPKKSKEEPGPWLEVREPVVEVDADPALLPPLISRELWEQAQVTLKRRSQRFVRGRGVTNPRLLTGLLYCPCGGSLSPKAKAVKQGTSSATYQYYRCWQDSTVEPCPHRPSYINGLALEHHVEQEFLKRVRTTDFQERVYKSLAAKKLSEVSLAESQEKELREQFAKLDKQLAFVDQQFLNQVITIEEARRLRATVDDQRGNIEQRLRDIKDKLHAYSQDQARLTMLQAQFGMIEKWDRLGILEKKEVLGHFIHKIEALRTKGSDTVDVTIYWATDPELPADSTVPQPGRRASGA